MPGLKKSVCNDANNPLSCKLKGLHTENICFFKESKVTQITKTFITQYKVHLRTTERFSAALFLTDILTGKTKLKDLRLSQKKCQTKKWKLQEILSIIFALTYGSQVTRSISLSHSQFFFLSLSFPFEGYIYGFAVAVSIDNSNRWQK